MPPTTPLLTLATAVVLLATAAVQAPDGRRDLQSLIAATPPGGTLRLDPGVYAGGVEVDRPMTLEGAPGTVVDAGGEGTAIEVAAPGVTIRGLEIRGTGDSLDRENAGVSVNAPGATIRDNRFTDVLFGVFARRADGAVVAGNEIHGKDLPVPRRGDAIRLWETPDAVVEDNRVIRSRDVVVWFSDDVVIRGNEVHEGRYGLHFMYTDNSLVEGNLLEDNSTGAFLMYSRDLTLRDNVFAANHGPSGYGVGLKDVDGLEATGNRWVGNRVGLYLDNSPASVNVHQAVHGNLFAYNETGVVFLPSVRRNAFWDNAFVDNRRQVGLQGGGRLTGNDWVRDGTGNHWSDFAGYDADGDGIGDVDHRIEPLYGTLVDRHPATELFADTPAARALDLAARMFPALRPEPTVVDTAPRLTPPRLPPLPSRWHRAGGAAGAAVTSAALLILALGIVVTGRPVRRGPRRRPVEVAA